MKYTTRIVMGVCALAMLAACSPSSTDEAPDADPKAPPSASSSTQKNPPSAVPSDGQPAQSKLVPAVSSDPTPAAKVTATSPESALTPESREITQPNGIRYKVLKSGTGNPPELGSQVSYHVTCRVARTGRVFWDSRKTGQPQVDRLAHDNLIEGLVEMLSTMKPGEQREVFVPFQLAYGDRGAPYKVPGRSDITMDVELLGIQ